MQGTKKKKTMSGNRKTREISTYTLPLSCACTRVARSKSSIRVLAGIRVHRCRDAVGHCSRTFESYNGVLASTSGRLCGGSLCWGKTHTLRNEASVSVQNGAYVHVYAQDSTYGRRLRTTHEMTRWSFQGHSFFFFLGRTGGNPISKLFFF